jgi:hypothetical protein
LQAHVWRGDGSKRVLGDIGVDVETKGEADGVAGGVDVDVAE